MRENQVLIEILYIGIPLAGIAFCLWYTRAIPLFSQRRRLRAWRSYAETAGLTCEPGFFFGPDIPPEIHGVYRGREIRISAYTRGKFGFRDAETEVEMGVHSRATAQHPGGAFLLIRAHSKWPRLLHRTGNRRQPRSASGRPLLPRYEILSRPEGIGVHLLPVGTLQRITRGEKLIGIMIREQALYCRKKGIDPRAESLQAFVDELCDLAEVFERLSTFWLD